MLPPITLFFKPDLLSPVRRWLSSIDIQSPTQAHRLCRLIPASCPFAREIKVFDRFLLQIPPLCKLNPFYEQIIELRFRALMYLADRGEDVASYC
ncbi:MAG: nitrogenase [Leptolyngbya sp. ERB_1_1]